MREREREYKTTNQKNEKIHMFNFVGEIDVSREYVVIIIIIII